MLGVVNEQRADVDEEDRQVRERDPTCAGKCWLPRSSALPFPASIPELSAAFPGVWSPVA